MAYPISGELVGEAGDVMIFPPGSLVTMQIGANTLAGAHITAVYNR